MTQFAPRGCALTQNNERRKDQAVTRLVLI